MFFRKKRKRQPVFQTSKLTGSGSGQLANLLRDLVKASAAGVFPLEKPVHISQLPPGAAEEILAAENASGLSHFRNMSLGWTFVVVSSVTDPMRGYDDETVAFASFDFMSPAGRGDINFTARGWVAHFPVDGSNEMMTQERGESLQEAAELLREWYDYLADNPPLDVFQNLPPKMQVQLMRRNEVEADDAAAELRKTLGPVAQTPELKKLLDEIQESSEASKKAMEDVYRMLEDLE